jgi:hypothetical protein
VLDFYRHRFYDLWHLMRERYEYRCECYNGSAGHGHPELFEREPTLVPKRPHSKDTCGQNLAPSQPVQQIPRTTIGSQCSSQHIPSSGGAGVGLPNRTAWHAQDRTIAGATQECGTAKGYFVWRVCYNRCRSRSSDEPCLEHGHNVRLP